MGPARATPVENALARWTAGSPDGPAAPGRPGEPGRSGRSGRSALELLEAAEAALEAAASGDPGRDPASAVASDGEWHRYLDLTGRPDFLLALPDRDARERWAATTFRAIRASGYSLLTMLEQRVRSHGDRILFEDRREPDTPRWSYAEVARYASAVAGVFLDAHPDPRVVLFCENNVDGAVADLACLTRGILVSPLNVHTDTDTLAWIVERMDINIAVTDTDARHARLADACQRSGRHVAIFRTGGRAVAQPGPGLEGTPLRQASARVDLAAVTERLAARRPAILAPATVMFTSGSTGESRGVVFSQYMLVAKRFARAAALPAVGESESLVCYLPLFHTFGRYLEMLGMLYWRGTYVFAGNPSAEALMAELARVRPTGLISVPVRWTQIREQCLEAMERAADPAAEAAAAREVMGGRLRWGLSAAGYLDPQVFRFFQRHGVELCSGFGMTEATGGITMTPPGEYVDGTVGIPLPGMRTELGDDGELRIAGEYVASYLERDGAPGSLPALDPDAEHWVATGDLFRHRPDGYYQIVDRIKDIYKNSRGQTVAPQRIERRFENVPGIRRAFLAGDHRDHNVLLLVPDETDPVLTARGRDEAREYFARIVASANTGLAPYERAVSFAVLDRDFDVERGELTPKGSYRRKAIEANFAEVIEGLYRSKHVDLEVGPLRIRIPRWFFRDLGILEEDISARDGALVDRRSGRTLRVARGDEGRVRVGDLEYRMAADVVNLGIFARQPRLWLGNPALVAFSPCKPGWDVSLGGVSEQVRLPRGIGRERVLARAPEPPAIDDERLRRVHLDAATALFAPMDQASPAVERLGEELRHADARLGSSIRRRIEALAFRREEPMRALAYRTLVLDIPVIDYDKVFPAFLESGLSFLDEENITAIASARRGERRLQSLRQRLYSYRTNLTWPGPPMRRRQLRRVFRMLADHVRHHPHDVAAVQAELAAWALFREDPALARAALRHFDDVSAWHEERLRDEPEGGTAGKLVFELVIPDAEAERVARILSDPTFLPHSISHALDDDGFSWDRVAHDGAWVSPVVSQQQLRLYRLGINMVDGRHFDLLLAVGEALGTRQVKDTILWLTALSDHAFGAPSLPRFGAWRRDLQTLSLAYVNDLTAWERIRELSSRHDLSDRDAARHDLRKLYIRAMATFFRAWEQSGYRIVPGPINPSNVALPDADFHERTSILSLSGWQPYDGPLSLVRPMVRSFYRLTGAHYPRMRENLRLEWIFDGAVEALGEQTTLGFLDAVEAELDPAGDHALLDALRRHRQALAAREHVPLPVLSAIDRYRDWERMNPGATAEAREESVLHMFGIYRLERFPDAYRYLLYWRTYFAAARSDVQDAFQRLLRRCLDHRGELAGHLEELSVLQALLRDPADRAVFSRMVFPTARPTQQLEVLATGAAEEQRLIVRSGIRDDSGTPYVIREPLSAAEVGHLYRLILEAGYRMHVAEHAMQLVIADAEERIVGGLSYRWEDGHAVAIDAIVVARSLTHHGLGGKLIDDFCVRVEAQGARVVKTNFFLKGLFTKHGFHVDERWGGLVRRV
jgi:long-chain acyl-CoA synthetase